MSEPARGSFRRRVYMVLEGGQAAGLTGGLFEFSLIALIVSNVVAYTLQSVPDIDRAYHGFFVPFEAISVCIFSLEYLTRIWCAPEDPLLDGAEGFLDRLRYALKPMMMIDFIAVAPGYLALFIPVFDFRFLRLIRLLRLLKIARYSPALSTLAQVIIDERRALFGTLLLLICATVFAAASMHVVEGALRPKEFGTIPAAMWWAIQTLTTVGYGDVVPVTGLGRIVASITMIVGVGLLALPVGIVATGFVNIIHRRDFVVTFAMLARVPLFQGFSPSVLSEIMSLLRAQTVSSGGLISAKGERAAAMYFIVSGDVDVEAQGRKLVFGAGDFFGELALLHETMRSATIIARTPTRLLTLSTDDFLALMNKHPALQERLKSAPAIKAFAGEIAEAEVDDAGRARDAARAE